MFTAPRALRAAAVTAAALLLLAPLAQPAWADDALTVVSGSQPTAFFEVLGDVAEGAGFFKAQHLNVTIDYAGNPYSASQLIASGKGDIGSQTVEPIIQGYDKGVRLTAFLTRDPNYEYVVAVPADSPIHTLADFKGQSLGEYSPGSAAEVSTNAMLGGAGLKRSDYSFIPIGNGAQAINAMVTQKVAGAAFPFVELQIYVVNANQKYRYFWDPILKDIGDVAYVATPQTLATKADALKRFSRAIVQASILIRVNPQLAAKYFVQQAGLKMNDQNVDNEAKLLELSQSQLPGVDPMSKTIGRVSPIGMGVLARFLHDNGLTNEVVPTSAIVNTDFIDYANDFDHKAFVAQAKAMH